MYRYVSPAVHDIDREGLFTHTWSQYNLARTFSARCKMREPPVPENETARLAALHQLGILDTQAEERFDRITRIAKIHFDVAIALVSLVDADRQWFKSCQGLDASETPRNISFCGHAILRDNVFVVTNAIEHPDFADNPLVIGPPNIRFYAGAPLHAEDGERVGTLCIIDPKPRTFSAEDAEILRDLANCVEGELALAHIRKSERFLKAIADSMPGLVAYWDRNLVCRFANAPYLKWFGKPAESIIGTSMLDLLGDQRFADNQRYIQGALAGRPQYFEWILSKADDSIGYTWANYIPDIDLYGKVAGFFVLVTDVTPMKEAERQVSDAENRLRAILNSLMDGIITIDGKGIIIAVNPAAVRLFGYAVEEVTGQNIKMLMPEPNRSSHDGHLARYQTKEQTQVIGVGRELEGQTKAGRLFPMELTVTEIEIDGRRMFVGVIRDLSERKKIERMKEEFVSTVSHELRTPLTAIRGSLSLVNSGVLGDVPDEVRELTEVAEQSSERLVLLINDILDVEKIGSGQLRLEITQVGADELLAKALADTKGYADNYGIGLRAEGRAAGIRFRADSHRMIQVLANLISNAVKFSPPGDEVVVSTSLTQAGLLRFSVMDHGPGISEEFRARIFEKFAQADASDSKVKGGTGLGLAITKGLVERMGGEIRFETQPGQGTIFHVDFPVIVEMPTAAIREAHGPGLRVLHVEDDEATRLLLARLLSAEAEVVGACSVVEAIALARSQSFDLAVIDLGLPDGNGLEVLSHVEGRDGRPVPAAIFSALDDAPADLPANVGAVLVKSRVSDRDLAQTLLSLMGRTEVTTA